MLKELCLLNGTSGEEKDVRDFIISQIDGKCEYSVDALGSIIAFKKGKKLPVKKVMICAHMDEVGFIVTHITDDGDLKLSPVGGIDADVVIGRKITVNGIMATIGTKAVHLMSDDEKKGKVSFDSVYADIGAQSREEALKYVSLGDFAYFKSDYYEFGNGYIKSKALDDRIGCMLMIELINTELEYDTYFCFNVQEEVGLRGAACTSYAVQSGVSIILESTTAADIDGVEEPETCCILGNGPVVSYMDSRTVYDRVLFKKIMKTAEDNGIKTQTKTMIAGGNDAGAVQTSGKGSKVAGISLPCRYIHSGASVVKKSDIEETRKLLKAILTCVYD